jgi:methylase of polypeptide subunit release factors
MFLARNYFAPLSNPKHIFDIGTGTGQWAIETGDEFPEAEIQATDLSYSALFGAAERTLLY